MAVNRNKAVMAGTGGDEFFGGYPWRYEAALDGITPKKQQIHSLNQLWHRLLPSTELSAVLSMHEREHETKIGDTIRNILEMNSTNENTYSMRDLMYFDMKVFLHGLLIVEDKLSMMHGLEVRVPFLDEDLVNFALTLPQSHLIRQKTSPNSRIEGKILLRDLMKKMNVGSSHGVKKGFSGPDEIWFRNKIKVLETIGKDAHIWNFLHRERTYNLLEHHFQGKKNLRLFVWSLLQLELTLRKVHQL
jgi:asparagine synthase (glutamine-hydrolysing)